MKHGCSSAAAAGLLILAAAASRLAATDIRTIGATPGEDRYPVAVKTITNPEETRFVVAFEYELSETDHDIYLAWSNNYGRDWNIRQAATANIDERHPRLAVGLADTIHLVFESADTLGWIYASPYNFSWTKTSWASTWSTGCRYPDVACDPVTNTIWFVMEKGTGNNHNITACHMDGVARTYDTVTVAKDAKNEIFPSIACDMNNVLVLYEYHDGANVDVRGATSKTGTAAFTAVQVAQSPAVEYHPEVVSTTAGFEYVYQTPDSMFYGFSTNGTNQAISGFAQVQGEVAPTIDADGNSADILIRVDSATIRHYRISGQAPSAIKAVSATVPNVTLGERQVAVITEGDSAFCVWSGNSGVGSANIYGTWWSQGNAFAVTEHLNTSYDYVLRATPNPMLDECTISFVPSTEGFVDVSIFDVSGRCVKTLLSKRVLPAYFTLTWNGTDQKGNPAPEGVYFVRLSEVSGVRSEKIVLVR
jgi:hypothetical protein